MDPPRAPVLHRRARRRLHVVDLVEHLLLQRFRFALAAHPAQIADVAVDVAARIEVGNRPGFVRDVRARGPVRVLAEADQAVVEGHAKLTLLRRHDLLDVVAAHAGPELAEAVLHRLDDVPRGHSQRLQLPGRLDRPEVLQHRHRIDPLHVGEQLLQLEVHLDRQERRLHADGRLVELCFLYPVRDERRRRGADPVAQLGVWHPDRIVHQLLLVEVGAEEERPFGLRLAVEDGGTVSTDAQLLHGVVEQAVVAARQVADVDVARDEQRVHPCRVHGPVEPGLVEGNRPDADALGFRG